MDSKIRNIEWCEFHPPPRHTAFKETHATLRISGKVKKQNIPYKRSWPFDQNGIAPLNEPCIKAADFVRKYGISRSSFFYISILVRCRGPPLLCFGKTSDTKTQEGQNMQHNNQQSNDFVQNQFTAYLAQAVYHTRCSYLRRQVRCKRMETLLQMDELDATTVDSIKIENLLPVWMQLENNTLLLALKSLTERERDIFLSRILDEKSFEVLAEKYDISYKAAASTYYRAIRKMRKQMGGTNE